ncbi:glutamate-5-semialdehyde dehydrogenase [Alicyclobacillus sp. ALC3]|uniref:glutamate-5-semialdehyde dehydrogenase n=1 Tax=Alicyclobacillus sp. ALC3 TaxID=2796143 RepID=UPI002379D3DD|nr:glutamate-5-semialdehyde dehydrogenase [Alicyclobacillus sp. ALC3]WDL96145.1 glutamate-5-semialdehyde dehydrogenase [Alicyclobacillus sp. ALC3]
MTTQDALEAIGLKDVVYRQLRAARRAAAVVGCLRTEVKNNALQQMAAAVWSARAEVLDANARDIDAAKTAGQPASRIDRLQLTETRLSTILEGLQQVASLPDPVGDVLDAFVRPNGLFVEQVRVPMGVVAMIYESRPNVTVDGAGLCLKTGNAVVLRGSRESLESNRALVRALRSGLQAAGLPEDAVQLVEGGREAVDIILQARGFVDLAIPRGGAGLIARVVEQAKVPVIETGVGNCHVYVDTAADLEQATAIVMNAKTQRPSVCNAAETLLVHEEVALAWLPVVLRALEARGVEVRACPRTQELLQAGGAGLATAVALASQEDFATEFLDLVLAVRTVKSLEEALDHIAEYGTKHSEVIVTEDAAAAETFLRQVDAAAVYHNASSRFTDGFEFGFGAEIGISTQKLHARGPMGLRELTSYKYLVRGNGQIRS